MSATAQQLLTLKVAAEDCIKAAGLFSAAEIRVKMALHQGDGKKACLELAKAEDAMQEVFNAFNAVWTVETKAAIDAANAAHDRIVEIRGQTYSTATEAAGYLPGRISFPICSGENHGRNVDEILAEIREARSGIDYDKLLTLVGTEYGEAMRMLEPTTLPEESGDNLQSHMQRIDAAMLDDSTKAILRIASDQSRSAEDRLADIYQIDARFQGKKSEELAKLLGVTDAAIRKLPAWKKERRRKDNYL